MSRFNMAHSTVFLFVFASALLASTSFAAIVEHSLTVGNLTVQRLCQTNTITAVNGSLPGPIIRVREGDTVVIHVFNESPFNATIHWHGVFQIRSGWADGPAFITQCPIRPGHSYTYRFNITGQEGTLWWHAHFGVLRATVHGALIIRPRLGQPYAFPRRFRKPHREFPLVLGEYWKGDIMAREDQATAVGGGTPDADAYTINGQPGDLYNCSSDKTITLNVQQGKTYLLRVINAALNTQLFFKIAQHNFTVVAVDALYTEPYATEVIVLAPGQTTDVLFTANQSVGNYYLAAHAYVSQPQLTFHDGTTTAIIHYEGAPSTSRPIMPVLPSFSDTPTAFTFYSNLTGLITGPHWFPCPKKVDERMFVTIGLGVAPCGGNNSCTNPFGSNFRFAASMNNASFVFPSKTSLLEAFHFGTKGIFNESFPSRPPLEFDFTNTNFSNNLALIQPEKSTRVKRFKYNSTVEIVLQNHALVLTENHPMHLHGFDFYVLAQGFGNFNKTRDSKKFNLVNPQERNTIAVPVGGWAVIRFRANNPGAWFIHCHLDVHLPWGLATAFLVEDGPTPETSLPPPPADLPKC